MVSLVCRTAILILALYWSSNLTANAAAEQGKLDIERALYEQALSFPSRPEDVSPTRWEGLRTAVEQAKLLPSPEGIGGEGGEFGFSISVDGNRAAIGGLRLAGSGAVVVYTLESGTWVEEAILVPEDGDDDDNFGHSVSLHGSLLLVGAPRDDENGFSSGSAYLFDFDGSVWTQTAKLIASDGAESDQFGWSVSLFGDKALVGAFDDNNDNGFGSGSAYIFESDGTVWNEREKLISTNGASGEEFGKSVSLYGTTAVIGAPRDTENGFNSGSAYIFDFNGSFWEQTTKLLPGNGSSFDQFGFAVSLLDSQLMIGAPNTPGSGTVYVFDLIDQLWIETSRINVQDLFGNIELGSSISMSTNRVVVGAPDASISGSGSGAAYVFDFDGESWLFTTRLEPSDGQALARFGTSVGLLGNSVLIGASRDGENFPPTSGSAYGFAFDGAKWNETLKLERAGAGLDEFGISVSLFGDRALVGAPFDDNNDFESGSAYIFEFDGSSWVETANFFPSDSIFDDAFGRSVSLFGDRALIGAPILNPNRFTPGAAYVFDFDGTTWNETAKLVPSTGGRSDRFGFSVSLFGDRALIGMPNGDDNGSGSGTSFVFDFRNGMWAETAKLLPEDGSSGDTFGYAVSLFSDRALIGAYRDDDRGSNSGSAYVFDFIGAAWRETAKLLPVDGAPDDWFGWSVSLFGDRALVGAPQESFEGTGSGSAYVFDFNNATWTETTQLLPGDGAPGDEFGASVSIFGNRAVVGATGDDDNGEASGSAYVYNIINGNWRETAKLLPADGLTRDEYGVSASLFSNRILVGAYRDDDNGANSGSAYVFDLLQIFQDDFESEL